MINFEVRSVTLFATLALGTAMAARAQAFALGPGNAKSRPATSVTTSPSPAAALPPAAPSARRQLGG